MSHIFVSYSRKDIDFAKRLVEALKKNELDIWIDWKDIPKGEDFEQEIYRGIEAAEAFLFLLSIHSITSKMCNKEIVHAVKNNKRILPIVVCDSDLDLDKFLVEEAKEAISKPNWIYCREGEGEFERAIEETQTTIHTDYEWVKFHTQLQLKALEWERNAPETGFLLHGKELQDTNSAFLTNSGKDPSPTDLQRQYLAASQEYEESLRKKADRQRRWTIIGLSLGLIIVTVIGVFAWGQRNSAVASEATTIASERTTVAESDKRAIAEGQAVEKSNALATEILNVESAQETAEANAGAARTAEAIAKDQVLIAKSENLAALALDRIDTNYTESLLLGVESHRLLQVNALGQGRHPDILPALLQKIPTGLMRTQAAPPFGGVHKISYSPDGNLMVTLSDTIDLWDTRDPLSPESVESWDNSPGSKASDAAFSPDSAMIAVGYQDGHIELWNVNSASTRKISELVAFPSQTSLDVKVAISIDGKLLACSGNGTVILFDISNPISLQEIGHVSHPHEGAEIDYLWFDPNFENPYLVTGGQDNNFRIWNLKEASFRPNKYYFNIPRGGGIANIAISAKYLAVAGTRTIDLSYNLKNGSQWIATVPYSNVHRGLVESMSFSPSGARLFTAGQDGTLAEWDITSPSRIKLVKVYSGHTNRVTSATFHPAGNIIASGGEDSRIVFWDIRRETVPSIWQGQIASDAEITDIAYSLKTGLLAVGDQSGRIAFWDLSNPNAPAFRRNLAVINPIATIAFNPAETDLFFMGGKIGNYRPTAYSRDITRLEYSENLTLLETNTTAMFVSGNEYILAGEIANGQIDLYRWPMTKEGITREHSPVIADACPFNDAVFARDGSLAAVAACTLQLWDFSEGQLPAVIEELESTNPQAVALNPGGTLLISANAEGNSFSIWSILEDGKTEPVKTQNDAHLSQVTSVAISPDETILATGSADKSVILWDITLPANPVQRVVFQGHSSAVLRGGIFFSADGKTLISASKDEVILWDIDPESWLERACHIAGRNFTSSEWEQYVGNTISYHLTCPQYPKGK